MSKLYKNKEKEKENEKPSNEPITKQNSLKRMSSKILGDSLNSFDLSGKLEQVDEYLKNYPFIIEFGYKIGIKPSYIVVFGGSALFISLVLGWGAALICNLVGFAYPAYQSFKAVESQGHAETKLWLTYWVVFSLFFFIEYLIDIILFWVPFYYVIKLLFLLYLYMPQVRGAETVYNYVIRPILLKHEKAIDDTVHKISQTATNHLNQFTGNIAEKLVQEGVRRRNV
ncbi:hypothetical protein YYC_03482 [Plasmodium yoelii 17X]|nr:hypothetical protein YYC_03482 [Plasmodium yoelii 17X]